MANHLDFLHDSTHEERMMTDAQEMIDDGHMEEDMSDEEKSCDSSHSGGMDDEDDKE